MLRENGNGRATIREVFSLVQSIDDKIDRLSEHVEKRLDSLERWRAYLSGALAILTFSAGIALTVLR